MPNFLAGIEPARLLFDLQQSNEIAESLAGCLEPEEIAHRVTEGLVAKFDCAFARLWLLDSDALVLKLVASSGLYTHTNGSFASVPMGAYKVGKIAQNRISFLSNNLAEEPWVGNRAWAVANNINGFAGYPLVIHDQVVGVLAMFSHQRLEPEFLEILQFLCTVVSLALDTALQFQKAKQTLSIPRQTGPPSLSEQLVHILHSTRLTLIGTEQPLSPTVICLFLQVAEQLQQWGCPYGRLVYAEASVALEASLPIANQAIANQTNAVDLGSIQASLAPFQPMATYLGGSLQTQASVNHRTVQLLLNLPYSLKRQPNQAIQIQCRLPLLQLAFTQLATLAGIQVGHDQALPLLTDDPEQIQGAHLWVQQDKPAPKQVRVQIDLSTTPEQLQQAVAAATQGETWGIEQPATSLLSEREIEILRLLTQGHRDRNIADQLMISESTVKFHLNNVLTKLKVRTRYQAIHQAMVQGWID
jgi:DNA-binding CsgD family transcriptional regulator